MQNVTMLSSLLGKITVAIFYVLFSLICITCTGQNKKDVHANTDLTHNTQSPRQPLPKFGVNVNTDPLRPGGYVFCNLEGKEIAYLAEDELYNKNPYKNLDFPPVKIQDNGYASYSLEGFSEEKILNALSNHVKIPPKRSVLKEAGILIAALVSWDYYRKNPQHLLVSYGVVLYDKQSWIEIWAESTMHVYNNEGKLVSEITDAKNIQGGCISPDGNFIVANLVLGATGDGQGDQHIGLAVYDVNGKKFIGKINNKNGTYLTNARYCQYEDGCFLIYASLYRDNVEDEYTLVKLIINPKQKLFYQKKSEPTNNPLNDSYLLHLKSSQHPNGEDVNTYERFQF
ncbi:MAG: hypothetical protein IT270_06295 [Saprospiraceae bacterium]|nr:hypothetical protein [Saprospiraceae bacterium]